MKTQILLDIRKPCSEKWENFKSTSDGGFCNSCSKVVIDFTKMNDEEILNFFNDRTMQTCGRFRSDQLKHYAHIEPVTIRPGFGLLKAGLLSLFLFLANRPGVANPTNQKAKSEVVQFQDQQQEKSTHVDSVYTVKGMVKSSDDGLPLPGVNIYLKGSTDGTVSDSDGLFVFRRKLKEGDVLIFSFIGFDTKEYIVRKDANETIELTMGMSYCIMMGEVAVDQVYKQKQSGAKRLWHRVKSLF